MLEKEGITISFHKILDGFQIEIFELEKECEHEYRIVSIIQHRGSYGSNQNLLEIMGLLNDEELENDSVVGYLTAENVFDRIKKYMKKK